MAHLTRRNFSGCAIAAGVLAGSRQAIAGELWPGVPTDSVLRNILAQRVNDLTLGQGGIGLVAGVLDPHGRRVVSVGQNDKSAPRALAGDSVFEIGSVGKVFTALLLGEMVVHREVSLDDPVARYLSANTRLPKRNGRAIRIIDLATHTSGLPFMPDPPKANGANATPNSRSDLYRFLATYKLTRDPGSDWDYSNLGYWLLGEALAARAGQSFITLLHRRVLVPLNMTDSGFELTARMNAKLAIGHEASLQPAPSMLSVPLYNLMPAAGVGFYSTADDLLTFLGAAMGYSRSPLAAAFSLSVDTLRPVSGTDNKQALGWTLLGKGPDQLVFRDGGTLGFASCIAWRKVRRAGAVVLANAVSDVSDIARHILAPQFPLVKPQVNLHREIALSAAILGSYAGRYIAPGEGAFTVTLEGDHLAFEAPPDWGLPKLRIRPETQQRFFANELPLRVEFQDADTIAIHPPRGQKAIMAKRDATPPK